MIFGYARISRDEDRNYISIDNQKLIGQQYAQRMNFVIDTWYVDDDISGYSFDRPGFQAMMDIVKTGDTIVCKDLSRLGRHNAKLLLLIDELKERNIRLLLFDDDYDSLKPDDDDILGIKTWYNERYVKDTSKKIRKMFNARQENGTMIVHAPFGYQHVPGNKYAVEFVEREVQIIKRIGNLYLQGYGYRKIAETFNEEGVLTPSQMLKQRDNSVSKVATKWSAEMVRDILKNDYYTGTWRLRKRRRKKINGSDVRVPKEEQVVHENHHEAIWDRDTFIKIQNTMQSRIINNYRGTKKNENIFQQLIVCADCGSRLIPGSRTTGANTIKYYVCNTYNSKGNKYCSSHRIMEKELVRIIIKYLEICRDNMKDDLINYKINQHSRMQHDIQKHLSELKDIYKREEIALKSILEQKAADSIVLHNQEILARTYDGLIQDKLQALKRTAAEIDNLQEELMTNDEYGTKVVNALDIMNHIIESEQLTYPDVAALIDKICVEADGSITIEFKYGLGDFISPHDLITQISDDYKIMLHILSFIRDEKRSFTSNKYLRRKLSELGYKVSQRKMQKLIDDFIEKGWLEFSGNTLQPLTIMINVDEWQNIIDRFEKDATL